MAQMIQFHDTTAFTIKPDFIHSYQSTLEMVERGVSYASNCTTYNLCASILLYTSLGQIQLQYKPIYVKSGGYYHDDDDREKIMQCPEYDKSDIKKDLELLKALYL